MALIRIRVFFECICTFFFPAPPDLAPPPLAMTTTFPPSSSSPMTTTFFPPSSPLPMRTTFPTSSPSPMTIIFFPPSSLPMTTAFPPSSPWPKTANIPTPSSLVMPANVSPQPSLPTKLCLLVVWANNEVSNQLASYCHHVLHGHYSGDGDRDINSVSLGGHLQGTSHHISTTDGGNVEWVRLHIFCQLFEEEMPQHIRFLVKCGMLFGATSFFLTASIAVSIIFKCIIWVVYGFSLLTIVFVNFM